MKVGEIIFYYAEKEFRFLYLCESQRKDCIQRHKHAISYKIIPYAGEGAPVYINRIKKMFAYSIEAAAALSDIPTVQFYMSRQDKAFEWQKLQVVIEQKIKAA